MGQTPIKLPNTITNNAAKDDTITEGVSFTIDTLLANDPGGAAKNSCLRSSSSVKLQTTQVWASTSPAAVSRLSPSSWLICQPRDHDYRRHGGYHLIRRHQLHGFFRSSGELLLLGPDRQQGHVVLG